MRKQRVEGRYEEEYRHGSCEKREGFRGDVVKWKALCGKVKEKKDRGTERKDDRKRKGERKGRKGVSVGMSGTRRRKEGGSNDKRANRTSCMNGASMQKRKKRRTGELTLRKG